MLVCRAAFPQTSPARLRFCSLRLCRRAPGWPVALVSAARVGLCKASPPALSLRVHTGFVGARGGGTSRRPASTPQLWLDRRGSGPSRPPGTLSPWRLTGWSRAGLDAGRRTGRRPKPLDRGEGPKHCTAPPGATSCPLLAFPGPCRAAVFGRQWDVAPIDSDDRKGWRRRSFEEIKGTELVRAKAMTAAV